MFLFALIPFVIAQSTGTEAQQSKPAVVITVCDALCNPLAYEGVRVYLVGRLQPTPEGVWLSQEKCPCDVIVDGERRNSLIALEYQPNFSQEGEYSLIKKLASEKLKEVQATTRFGEGDYEAVVFGEFRSVFGDKYRAEYGKMPKNGKTRNGFGHLSSAPAALYGNSLEGLGKETLRLLK